MKKRNFHIDTNMLKIFNTLALICLFIGTVKAQHAAQCATPAHFSSWLKAYQANPDKQHQRSADEMLYLPISFHSVGKSDGTGHLSLDHFTNRMCQLNAAFEPYQLQFYIDGEIHEVNRTSYYEHSSFNDGFRMMQANKKSFSINVFITDSAPSQACGYWHPSADGIVVRQACFRNAVTLVHEVGHWLSLPHTFFGWEGIEHDPTKPAPLFHSVSGGDTLFVESVSGKHCASAADGFCDTKPDYLSLGWQCTDDRFSSVVQQDPEGKEFQSDATNFMSYSADQCQSKFSEDQTAAMHAYIDFAKRNYLNRTPLLEDVDPEAEVLAIFPMDGKFVDHTNVTLEWEHVPNANRYTVQISRFSFFGTIEEEHYVVNSNKLNLGAMPLDRKFHWRVKPMNSFDVCTDYTYVGEFVTYDITAIEEVAGNNYVDIYPTILSAQTPQVNLEFDFTDITPTAINVFSISGQDLYQTTIENPSNLTHRIDFSGYSTGIYLLRIATTEGALVKRITVQ